MQLGKDVIILETDNKETPIRLVVNKSKDIDLGIDEIFNLRDLCQKVITDVIFPYPGND